MMMVFPEIYLAINLVANVGICSNIKQVDFSYIKAQLSQSLVPQDVQVSFTQQITLPLITSGSFKV